MENLSKLNGSLYIINKNYTHTQTQTNTQTIYPNLKVFLMKMVIHIPVTYQNPCPILANQFKHCWGWANRWGPGEGEFRTAQRVMTPLAAVRCPRSHLGGRR